jgi:hypothetical protein
VRKNPSENAHMSLGCLKIRLTRAWQAARAPFRVLRVRLSVISRHNGRDLLPVSSAEFTRYHASFQLLAAPGPNDVETVCLVGNRVAHKGCEAAFDVEERRVHVERDEAILM